MKPSCYGRFIPESAGPCAECGYRLRCARTLSSEDILVVGRPVIRDSASPKDYDDTVTHDEELIAKFKSACSLAGFRLRGTTVKTPSGAEVARLQSSACGVSLFFRGVTIEQLREIPASSMGVIMRSRLSDKTATGSVIQIFSAEAAISIINEVNRRAYNQQ